MGIEATFGQGKVTAKVNAFQKRIEVATIYLLKYLGESLVKYAIEHHNYTDQTGNLTNSIGYVVVQEGKPIFQSKGVNEGEGLKIAMKIASKTPKTFSLIIVASMNYAAYVEAMGYNVILPAELKAKKDFPAAMKKLVESAKSKAIELFGVAA